MKKPRTQRGFLFLQLVRKAYLSMGAPTTFPYSVQLPS